MFEDASRYLVLQHLEHFPYYDNGINIVEAYGANFDENLMKKFLFLPILMISGNANVSCGSRCEISATYAQYY
jgi:hypothetical protein